LAQIKQRFADNELEALAVPYTGISAAGGGRNGAGRLVSDIGHVYCVTLASKGGCYLSLPFCMGCA
jgi:hypothetical protein